VRDQIYLIRSEERSLGLVLLNSIDIRANLMEYVLENVVSQRLGRHDDKDDDEHDAEHGDKRHDKQQQGQLVEVVGCVGRVRLIHPVPLHVLSVVAQLCEEDTVVDHGQGQVAEKLVWVLELTWTLVLERLP